MDAAARSLSFALELPEQIQNLPRIVAAIDGIAELDEMSLAANPVRLGIDQPSHLQDLDESIVGAMDVADRHDALDPLPFARAFVRGGERPRDEQERDRGYGECVRTPHPRSFMPPAPEPA